LPGRIVLAGGRGLVGSCLARRFSAEGYDVIILTRSAVQAPAPLMVSYLQWDGRSNGSWVAAISGAAAVINLSGASLGSGRWTAKRKKEIVRSRVESTTALVEGVRSLENKPKVFINASAVGFYGDSGDAEVDESSPAGNGFLAETVRRWEASAKPVVQEGVRLVLLRSGVVLAAGAQVLKRLALPFRLFAGGPIGTGRQWMSWIHADDVAEGTLFSVRTPGLSGSVNLISPEPVRMKEFCSVLGKTLYRPSWLPVPGYAMRLLLGEMADMVLQGQRVIPRKLMAAGFQFRYPALPEALRELLHRR